MPLGLTGKATGITDTTMRLCISWSRFARWARTEAQSPTRWVAVWPAYRRRPHRHRRQGLGFLAGRARVGWFCSPDKVHNRCAWCRETSRAHILYACRMRAFSVGSRNPIVAAGQRTCRGNTRGPGEGMLEPRKVVLAGPAPPSGVHSDEEIVPHDLIMSWRGACTCGWQGELWQRVAAVSAVLPETSGRSRSKSFA